jgi:hypothetical protein
LKTVFLTSVALSHQGVVGKTIAGVGLPAAGALVDAGSRFRAKTNDRTATSDSHGEPWSAGRSSSYACRASFVNPNASAQRANPSLAAAAL